MTPKQLSRLEQGPGGFLRTLFYPEKTIGFPHMPNSKDGIMLHTEHKVSFMDRLRILFGGPLYITSMISCAESPSSVIANTVFMATPPFSSKLQNNNQPELPLQ